MVLGQGNESVRVTFKDYGFFVPKDGAGHRAVVEGTLEEEEMSEAMVKHLAEDAGEDPNAVTGTRKVVKVVATGVWIDGVDGEAHEQMPGEKAGSAGSAGSETSQ